ncbi:protein of unknown function [Magnetospirillum sp. XM-1]|nr:protein of unknown function [Magnetospirillum sp. XM-1]
MIHEGPFFPWYRERPGVDARNKSGHDGEVTTGVTTARPDT